MASQAQLDSIAKMNAAKAEKKANGLSDKVGSAITETTDAIRKGVIEIVAADGVINTGASIPETAGRKYTVVWQAPSSVQVITLGESIEVADTEILFADGSKILMERC